MRKLLLILVLGFGSIGAFAQGITTSLISGTVTGASTSTNAETKATADSGLPGANIVATHTPSGTTYGTVSQVDGRFTIPGMRVGGPYRVTVSFVGYETQEKNDVYLSLGNATNLDFHLVETGSQLQEVVISASASDIFNSDRTGSAVNIDKNAIMTVPNISRGLKDFTKLSPLASTMGAGTSFAGSNNRYNQFAIDGLVNNDVFGLAASGTNGGQTGIEPISLDAIEEFQINIAPYDVRQGGFTGGGINAITRSGTNTIQGSAYYFGNNESMVGKNNPNTSIEARYPDYKDFQSGFRIGGPIIKDKLFFFVNGEITRQKTPLAFAPGTPSSNILQSDVDAVLSTLSAIAPTYDPGAYNSIDRETNSNKFLVKLDYNINQNHKLTLRHSYTYGEQTDNSRSPNQLRFYNNGLFFPSTTNSTGLEVNSMFGTGKSNRLLVGFTTVRDDRDPLGSPFPFTTVNLTSGRSIVFGSENSSVANQLDQNILSITDDFTMYKGKHTITLGTNNEFYHFYNIFVQNIYGNYSFQSLAGFQSQATATKTAPSFYGIGYSFDATDDPSQSNGSADFNAMQLGVYGQDEMQLSSKLKVTAGLRLDLPIFRDKPQANDAFNAAYTEGQTGEVPDTKLLYSPRVGFNFDVMGDRSLQIRGGTGLFTGRVPFVWVSNQFTNNGQVVGTYTVGASTGTPLTNGITYNVDPYNQPLPGEPPIAAVTPGRGDINVISPNFKFPQVFRSNLAVDKSLPGGLSITVEGLLSKTLNNVNFENLQRQPISGFTYAGKDQRPRFTAASTSPTVAGYNQAGRLNASYNEIIALSNTNKGYTYNFVLQVQKQLQKGFTGSASWSYGDSFDLNSGTSSVAFSNWRFVNQVNGLNSLDLTRSNYSPGSRFMAWLSYRKDYLNNMAGTQISLFYNGQQGQAYSYVYNADMNNDGTAGNDLIFIPATQSDINLIPIAATATAPAVSVAEQWALLDEFLNTDTYLKTRRGQYAERNGSRTPFQNQLDVRLLQEFSIKAGNSVNKLQITLDIMNFGNMLNKEWGKQWTVPNQTATLINYTGLVDTAPGTPVNFATNQPTFTYNGGGQTNNKVFSAFDLTSRWRAQIGVRYIFN